MAASSRSQRLRFDFASDASFSSFFCWFLCCNSFLCNFTFLCHFTFLYNLFSFLCDFSLLCNFWLFSRFGFSNNFLCNFFHNFFSGSLRWFLTSFCCCASCFCHYV